MDKMVSMKRAENDKRENPQAAPIEATEPDYPYGLCIHLDKDELDKLGLGDLPDVGTTFDAMVKIKVTRVSQSAAEGAEDQTSIDLQITDMMLATAKAKK